MKSTLAFLSLIALGACTEHQDGVTGTQSLAIDMTSPTNTGDVDTRLDGSTQSHTVTVNIKALDAQDKLDTSFSATINIYAQFLGTLTPALGEQPLDTVDVENGVAATKTIVLPAAVLGPTQLWFDNGHGTARDYVPGPITGTSPTLWYRDPFISDIQTPAMENSLDALVKTPLTDKQISVSASRYGATGKLVVTSVFAQGYTLSDVNCATRPCTSDSYNHVVVFSFSAPRDQNGTVLTVGDIVKQFNGGVEEFNGLTEIGFPASVTPTSDVPTDKHDEAAIPAPVKLDPLTWFKPLSDASGGRIAFERNEAGLIEIDGATVCALDDDYTTYKQWKIDPSAAGACSSSDLINLITQGTDFSIDPATLVGKKLTKVIGILRPVNIGSFNVWIVYPRGEADITQ
ncbi:MAG TPA: hypothetical protein VGM90_10300 [Kofleriaceae bacterium]|jgi:hypothetical protein